METATLVPAAVCRHARIRVATERAMEFIDLTARLEALAAETLHTTTAIVVNEHEPLLLADFEGLLTRAALKLDGPQVRDVSVLVLGEGVR